MTKTLQVLLLVAAVPLMNSLGYGKKCPDPHDLDVKEINYDELVGDWELVASKPELNAKCKNITVKNDTKQGYTLHEEYFKKELYMWQKRSTKNYDIVMQLKPSPILELKNKSWYSIGTEKFRVIGVDYKNYIVLYSCEKGFFSISETVEVWSRHEFSYTAKTLPKEIKDVLAKFKISAVDLKFRSVKDCSAQ